MAFAYKASITIDHTKVPNTDQTNFPILVSGTYAGAAGVPDLRSAGNGGHVQSSTGYDIYFYSDSSLTTRIPAERELYTASTGQIIFWVKKTVTTAADTVIYIGYGDSGISTDPNSDGTYGKTSTWDSNFKSVLHLPDGSSLSVADSTGNQSPTNNGVTAASGFIDGAGSFVPPAFTYKYIDLGNITLAGTATYEAWVNFGGQGGNIYSQYNRMIESDYASAYYLGLDANGTSDVLFIVNGTFIASGSNKIDPGNWHHFVGTFDGSNGRLYRDGVLIAGPTSAIAPGSASKDTWVGANPNTPGDPTNWNGLMDEVRISNTARSADWVVTQYNNQSSPSSFYTMGSETSTGGGAVSYFRLASQGVG